MKRILVDVEGAEVEGGGRPAARRHLSCHFGSPIAPARELADGIASGEVESVVRSYWNNTVRHPMCSNLPRNLAGSIFANASTDHAEHLEQGLCAVEAADEMLSTGAIACIVAIAGVDNAAMGRHRGIVDLVAGDEDIVTWHLSYLLVF